MGWAQRQREAQATAQAADPAYVQVIRLIFPYFLVPTKHVSAMDRAALLKYAYLPLGQPGVPVPRGHHGRE